MLNEHEVITPGSVASIDVDSSKESGPIAGLTFFEASPIYVTKKITSDTLASCVASALEGWIDVIHENQLSKIIVIDSLLLKPCWGPNIVVDGDYTRIGNNLVPDYNLGILLRLAKGYQKAILVSNDVSPDRASSVVTESFMRICSSPDPVRWVSKITISDSIRISLWPVREVVPA